MHQHYLCGNYLNNKVSIYECINSGHSLCRKKKRERIVSNFSTTNKHDTNEQTVSDNNNNNNNNNNNIIELTNNSMHADRQLGA